jgi:hypothetical protein
MTLQPTVPRALLALILPPVARNAPLVSSVLRVRKLALASALLLTVSFLSAVAMVLAHLVCMVPALALAFRMQLLASGPVSLAKFVPLALTSTVVAANACLAAGVTCANMSAPVMLTMVLRSVADMVLAAPDVLELVSALATMMPPMGSGLVLPARPAKDRSTLRLVVPSARLVSSVLSATRRAHAAIMVHAPLALLVMVIALASLLLRLVTGLVSVAIAAPLALMQTLAARTALPTCLVLSVLNSALVLQLAQRALVRELARMACLVLVSARAPTTMLVLIAHLAQMVSTLRLIARRARLCVMVLSARTNVLASTVFATLV